MASRNSGTARHAFGVVLRTYRERAGLSRADLAARIFKSESLIEAIERGERVATEEVTKILRACQAGDQRRPAGPAQPVGGHPELPGVPCLVR